MSLLQSWEKVASTAAGTADIVAGVQPSFTVRPQDSSEVSAVLAAARADRLAVIPRGAATTLGWGPPPERADVILDTTALTGVVEHEAGDLVVTVRAGALLADLQAALASHGQRLALDGDHGGATVGGLVAHGLAGPSRLRYGTLRDLLIGATFVRPDGVVARTGGKVVKNVAGYDLGKLLHGSWGTLAVLTEVVFRLHPLAPASRWVTVTGESADAVGADVVAVVHSQLVASAAEVDGPAGGPYTVSILLEGREVTVGARAAALAALLRCGAAEVAEHPPSWWGRRPDLDVPAISRSDLPPPVGVNRDEKYAALLRLTTEVASLPRLLAAIDRAAADCGVGVHVRGSAGVGSLLATVAPTGGDRLDAPALAGFVGRLRAGSAGWGGTVVVLDVPDSAVGGLDRWGPVRGIELMRRVKDQFDPDRVLSPGRFVGGI
jgi:glycolate oxidase FAD binding subunit